MRDLLPAEAEGQGKLGSSVLSTFDLHGYQKVNLPAFEYADVLERGLGTIDPNSVLRFVEPETGEVVALRPDMTPQVARLVATRLADRPSPARLCYRGSVLRRQHERARHEQQALQAGIELIGVGGTDADLEVITVCATAVRDAGLESFVLDLGHGGIAGALLADVSPAARLELLECLSLKDGAEMGRRAAVRGVPAAVQASLIGLLSLQGGPEVFDAARAILSNGPAWPLVEELRTLYLAIVQAGIAPKIVVDLGETRTAAYYTGPMFQILAEGPGQAVASGGRYDALYELFGAARPAAGAAIQLDHLRWALCDRPEDRRRRVVLVGGAPANLAAAAGALREAGIACVSVPGGEALDYAQAWRYSHIARAQGAAFRVTRVELAGPEKDAAEVDLGEVSWDQLATKIRL
jgi:ATP phosphoribosyltransferase regulatory subunit